jgi:chromosome segregation ATPase
MGRSAVLLLVLAAACKSGPNDLNLLELNSLKFKAENEEIRAEDLQARYEKRKARADKLATQLLALQHAKEEAYADYDRMRGELARLERDHASAVRERDEAAAALKLATAERKRLSDALAKERAEIERLQTEFDQLAAKRRALEAGKKSTEE